MKKRRNPSRGKRKFKKGLRPRVFSRPGDEYVETGRMMARMAARVMFRKSNKNTGERGN